MNAVITTAVVTTDRRAGFVTRLAALVVDAIILSAALSGTVSFLLLVDRTLGHFARSFSLGQLLLVCAPVIGCLYSVLCWWLWGRTPGKWLLGLRVVALGGGKVGLDRAALRFVGYLLSAIPFYLGFLWVLGPQRRAFHDRLAGTEVVYTRRPGRQRTSLDERPRVPRRYVTA